MTHRRLHRASRRGYVLVVALALLVLAATVMVGISRAAIRHASAAREVQADLQRRYGSISIRGAVLPRAESILANAEVRSGQPVPSLRGQIQLGSCRFEIIISDEQAKANLNRVLEGSGVQSVETRLREAMSGTGLGRAVHVRTAPGRPLTGIGQVLDLTDVSSSQLLDGNRYGAAPLALVTLWGDGRINLRRASNASARLALAPPLSTIEVERLLAGAIAKRAPQPGEATDPLTRLLAEVNVQGSVQGQSIGLTLGSTCHSICVISNDGRRPWSELEILDQSDPQNPVSSYFAW
jgi:hypothetical protein